MTGGAGRVEADVLAGAARHGPALAVVAHPDDESFGLGAVLAALADAGVPVRVLCLTHGEASTLGAAATVDLGEVREAELAAAASVLGVDGVALRDLPDGELAATPPGRLDVLVERHRGDAGLLVVFEPSGVTGHPDHRAATAAAHRVAARHGLAVLEWGVAPDVAATLNEELGTAFVPFEAPGATDVPVDRSPQLAAIACHHSQAVDNPVLARRLALEGGCERVRLVVPEPG